MAKKTAILVVKILSDAKGAGRGFRSAEKQVGKFTKVAGLASKALKVGVVSGMAVAATAIKKGFGRLKSLERANKELEALGYHGKQLKDIYQNALAAVDGTAYGVDQAMRASSSALAGGVREGKELTRWLRFISDATAMSRTDFDHMASILNKVKGNMKLTGQEIQQLGDNGLQVVPMLAESMGKTSEEIYKMASKGEISADMFQKAVEGKIGGAALKTAETVDGAWSQMWSSIGRIGANLLEDVYPKIGAGLRGITKHTKDLEPWAKKAGVALGQFVDVAGPVVAGVLEKTGNVLGKILGFIKAFRVELSVLVVGYAAYKAVMVATEAVGWAIYLWKSKDVIITAAQIAATKALRVAQTGLNAALRANPIGLIITAVTLLIAGFVGLYRRSQTFRSIVQAVGRAGQAALGWIIDKARSLATWLGDKLGGAARRGKDVAVKAFKAYTFPITGTIELVKRLIGWIKQIKFPNPPKWVGKLAGGVGGLFGAYVDPPRGGSGYALRPSTFTAPGELKAATPSYVAERFGRGGGGGVTIIIQGAVDPLSTARQIKSILARGDVASGIPVGAR